MAGPMVVRRDYVGPAVDLAGAIQHVLAKVILRHASGKKTVTKIGNVQDSAPPEIMDD